MRFYPTLCSASVAAMISSIGLPFKFISSKWLSIAILAGNLVMQLSAKLIDFKLFNLDIISILF